MRGWARPIAALLALAFLGGSLSIAEAQGFPARCSACSAVAVSILPTSSSQRAAHATVACGPLQMTGSPTGLLRLRVHVCRAHHSHSLYATPSSQAQLRAKLESEAPRNHLDARHRLDKDGKRYGKVIEYKLSELRMIELIDTLCDHVPDHQLAAANETAGTPQRWVKSQAPSGLARCGPTSVAACPPDSLSVWVWSLSCGASERRR